MAEKPRRKSDVASRMPSLHIDKANMKLTALLEHLPIINITTDITVQKNITFCFK